MKLEQPQPLSAFDIKDPQKTIDELNRNIQLLQRNIQNVSDAQEST